MMSNFSDIPFSSIAVIGAGTMGSAIAGQIANAGLDVLLLDMPDDDAEEVNRRSVDAVERLKKSDPPALFSKSCLRFSVFCSRISMACSNSISSKGLVR